MSSSLTKMLMYGRSAPFWNSFGSRAGYCFTRSASAAATVAPPTFTSVLPPACSRSGAGISTLIAMSLLVGSLLRGQFLRPGHGQHHRVPVLRQLVVVHRLVRDGQERLGQPGRELLLQLAPSGGV